MFELSYIIVFHKHKNIVNVGYPKMAKKLWIIINLESLKSGIVIGKLYTKIF
uniref:Uncharacterized protein n=1 Tax=Octopus bimaculoides TaxID=37653 RepID=A0A0L8H6F2_OCTBM